jgi:dTDP-4-dehydrorhamnose reductase
MATDKTILVTGANGQLGKEFRVLAIQYPHYNFLFADKEELPVNDNEAVKKYFTNHQINFCVNCAAYTAVDKAETEKEKAFEINAGAVADLAFVCKTFNVQLIHISTDYVFDGTAQQPYTENDATNPVSIYGQSKLKGEELALQNNPSVIIIRTSWVYSSYGNNFVKTMLRLMKERESINVVDDQLGCPTYAADLAHAIMAIIQKNPVAVVPHSPIVPHNTIFNYCNRGIISWYQFALAIKELTGSNCTVNPITTAQYPTPAKRPQYSVIDNGLIQNTFGITIPEWKGSLKRCLALLN